MMNCMKMLGLGITKDNYLYVRDHRSRGCPHIFWRHEFKSDDIEVHWKVGTADAADVAKRVLKKSFPLIRIITSRLFHVVWYYILLSTHTRRCYMNV
jgi:hypothetical protein